MDNADLLDGLRLSWWQAALEATGTSALSGWLSQRLDDLRGVDRLDRGGLIAVIDEVRTALSDAGRHDTEAELHRTLLHAADEYLVAVDTRAQQPPAADPIPDWYAVLPSDAPAVTAGADGAVAANQPPSGPPIDLRAEPLIELTPAAHSKAGADGVLTDPDGRTALPELDAAPPPPTIDPAEAPAAHAWASGPVEVHQLTGGTAAAFPSRRDPGGPDAGPGLPRFRTTELASPAIAAATLSADCDRMLGAGHHAEVAALLARVAASGGVAGLTPVAIAAGDHCRDAGATRAASDCYLAAWSADRLDDAPLWRLAELAMAAHDLELAVSYLDRVAAILQWRGDLRGAARVYRKMTILAPDRDDLRELLRQAQSATESVR